MGLKQSFRKISDHSYDIVDCVIFPLLGVFAAIGLVATSIAVYLGVCKILEPVPAPDAFQELIVSTQITEVSPDGVVSTVRKYRAKGIETQPDNTIKLLNVIDEYNNKFKSVTIQKNLPFIIEQKK